MGLGWASLNIPGALVCRVISSCPVPGSGVIRATSFCLLESKSRIERWSAVLVGLLMKLMLPCQSCAIFKN